MMRLAFKPFQMLLIDLVDIYIMGKQPGDIAIQCLLLGALQGFNAMRANLAQADFI